MTIGTIMQLQSLQHMNEIDRRNTARRLEKMIEVYAQRGIAATFSDDGESVHYHDARTGESIATRPITDFFGH